MIIKELRRPGQTSQGKVYTSNAFYLSKPWRELRARKLKLNPYCECPDCVGKKVIADLVDHVVPISQNGAALDINNLQSMRNHPCHDKKRARERNEKYRK